MRQYLFAWISVVTLFIGNVLFVFQSDHKKFLKANKVLVGPTRSIEHVTFGFKDIVADLMWLRVIQDYGLCEQARSPEGTDRTDPDRVKDCQLGWVYQMIDVVTHLNPRFRMPYATGATMLSVVVDDIKGATLIFEKALQQFPTDWSIAFRAAYHYLYEEENKPRAADLMLKAAKNGGPTWLYSLSAKIYSQTGKAEFGKYVLEDYLSKFGDKKGSDRIRMRLKQINKQLQQ